MEHPRHIWPKHRWTILARTRPEVVLAMALGVAAMLTLAILKLTSEIVEGDTATLDVRILIAVREATSGSSGFLRALRTAALDITALGNGVTLGVVVALVAGYLVAVRRKALALFLVFQVIAGTTLVALMKIVVGRERPDVVAHLTDYRSASFPSGHAADSAIVYLSLAILLVRITPDRNARLYVLGAAMLLTLSIGLSRIYLGVHWPSDVLAGWAIGAGWAMVVALLAHWMHLRRTMPA